MPFSCKKILVASLLGLSALSGCQEPYLDPWTLPWFGKSLHRSLKRVSLKQVHIELSMLEDHDLWLSGKVSKVGEHNTYFILSESSRNLLVIQTDIVDFYRRITLEDQGSQLSVVGRLILQKKGLPALHASLFFNKKPPASL